MVAWRTPRKQFLLALLTSSLVSLGLFAYGAWRNHSFEEFSYLPWNLVLAWLPLIFALRLIAILKRKLWSGWEGLALSVLWLVFLPNSFYMISDFIHLEDVKRVNVLYDTLMFTSFIYTGVALGFSSLYLIHVQLRRRLMAYEASIWVAITLLISSLAIYIGRDLRWNSWAVITNPGGLLFDISNRLQHPSSYPQMIMTIAVFFIVLASMYSLLWRGIGLLQRQPLSSRPVRYIAFYGTLKRNGKMVMHPILREHLTYLGHCHIPGRLYKLGRLVGMEASNGDVIGELYRLKDMQVLPQLDEYEAVDNVDPTRPGFSRVLVELSKPKVLAWVYFYDGNA
ncbi:MAG TPA: DUF1361 domain-containing protein [Candidatus Dormibacteraeota bacterium]|nr:DUF1361 domain-containing protein [Candidatus Dormibacteraeota bacterium]